MSIKALTIFSLLIVTNGNDVKFTDGFKAIETCEEAKSLAVNGRTLAKQKLYEEEQARQRKAEEERLKAACHDPQTEEEKYFVKNVNSNVIRFTSRWAVRDGKICPSNLSVGVNYGISGNEYNRLIKIAECVSRVQPTK